jgi:hypothetical protein
VFPLFSGFGVGAVSKNAIVTVDGNVYFINAQGRMSITDGTRIATTREIPRLNDVDDVWNGLNKTARNLYTYGIFYRGKDFRHIYWFVSNSTSTTNDLVIVWDVDNQCWLKYDSGYKMNVAARTQDGTLYGAAYDGKIYKMDVASTFSDASETSTNIDGRWRSGWENFNSLQSIKQFDWINVDLETQTAGNLKVRIGADYNENLLTKEIDIQAPGGKLDQFTLDVDVLGGQDNVLGNIIEESVRGNNLQLAFENDIVNETFRINGFNFTGKIYGQKEIKSS